MKTLLLLLFVTFSLSLAQGQNTEFVDSVIALHYETRSSFDLISFIIESTRESMRSYLILFNTEAVREVTEGLKSVVAIRDRTRNIINSATGYEHCVVTTASKWETFLNSTGPWIKSCVHQSVVYVNHIQDEINDAFDEQHKATFAGQNLILDAFSEVNIVTSQQNLEPFARNEADRISQNFFSLGMFDLYTYLDLLADFVEPSLKEIKECLHDVTTRITDESIVVANTLELC